MPVTLIGSKTNGKNVGMNVFSWSNVDGFDYEFAPISFQGYNAKKQSVDPKGITPDHAVDESGPPPRAGTSISARGAARPQGPPG